MPEISPPWETIQIISGFPAYAHIINSERLVGPISFKLHGDVPVDLRILISENHTAVTEQNATWTFRHRAQFSIYPSDQRSLNRLKPVDLYRFTNLNLVFDTLHSSEDFEFGVQITFPSHEKLEV